MMMVIRDTFGFSVAPTRDTLNVDLSSRQDTGEAIENSRPVLKFGC